MSYQPSCRVRSWLPAIRLEETYQNQSPLLKYEGSPSDTSRRAEDLTKLIYARSRTVVAITSLCDIYTARLTGRDGLFALRCPRLWSTWGRIEETVKVNVLYELVTGRFLRTDSTENYVRDLHLEPPGSPSYPKALRDIFAGRPWT